MISATDLISHCVSRKNRTECDLSSSPTFSTLTDSEVNDVVHFSPISLPISPAVSYEPTLEEITLFFHNIPLSDTAFTSLIALSSMEARSTTNLETTSCHNMLF